MNLRKRSLKVLNLVLAGSLVLGVGATSVFADEVTNAGAATSTGAAATTTAAETATETATETTTTATTVEAETVDTTATDTAAADTAAATDEQAAEEATDAAAAEEEDEPSLIPGDFFYFVKVMIEKIQLALTFDDVKEAQLLADFAQERIAEANALIAHGETELAGELLKKALETQESALEKSGEATESTTTETTEATETTGQNEAAAETATNLDAAEETGTMTTVVEPDDETESAEGKELKVKFRQNIISLMKVLEKVDNPKAQQAIAKNVQKSFEKFAKKTKKYIEADEQVAEILGQIDLQLSGEVSAEEAVNAETVEEAVEAAEPAVEEAEPAVEVTATEEVLSTETENGSASVLDTVTVDKEVKADKSNKAEKADKQAAQQEKKAEKQLTKNEGKKQDKQNNKKEK